MVSAEAELWKWDPAVKKVKVKITEDYWFTPVLQVWQQHKLFICGGLLLYLMVCIMLPVLVRKICIYTQKYLK